MGLIRYDDLEVVGREFKRVRALCKRRWNRGDFQGVIDAAQAWDAWMADRPNAPYPDAWMDVERYARDAGYQLQRIERGI